MNENNENKKKPDPMEHFYEFLFQLALTIALWIKVGQTNDILCQGPAWFWMNYAKVYYLVSASLSFLSFIFCRPKFMEEKSGPVILMTFVFFIVKLALKFAGIALSVGIIVSFKRRDECGDLDGVIIALFMLLMIEFGVLALVICCSITAVCIGTTGGSVTETLSSLKPSRNAVTQRLIGLPSYTKLLTTRSNSIVSEKPIENEQHNP